MNNVEKRIEQLEKEIAECRQAIVDAEEALDSAEKELREVLASLPLDEAEPVHPQDEPEPPLSLGLE